MSCRASEAAEGTRTSHQRPRSSSGGAKTSLDFEKGKQETGHEMEHQGLVEAMGSLPGVRTPTQGLSRSAMQRGCSATWQLEQAEATSKSLELESELHR